MKTTNLLMLPLLIAVVLLSSCGTKKKLEELQGDLDELKTQDTYLASESQQKGVKSMSSITLTIEGTKEGVTFDDVVVFDRVKSPTYSAYSTYARHLIVDETVTDPNAPSPGNMFLAFGLESQSVVNHKYAEIGTFGFFDADADDEEEGYVVNVDFSLLKGDKEYDFSIDKEQIPLSAGSYEKKANDFGGNTISGQMSIKEDGLTYTFDYVLNTNNQGIPFDQFSSLR